MVDLAHGGLRRSMALLAAFRVEQADPTRFYSTLAADSVRIVESYAPLVGSLVLDVGAGRAEFAEAFAAAGATYVALDVDELAAAAAAASFRVVGSGERLPFADACLDVVFASNVLEHVRHPTMLLDELVRVTRPGGLVVCGYTNWLSPWGGHETSPWHYAGAEWAARRYQRRTGHAPKNLVGSTLFPVSVGDGLRWAQQRHDVVLLDARPRYLPEWCRVIVRVPGVREVATWNLLLVLRRRPAAGPDGAR
ncbi:MAG TPA: class I SAM-dependent methyltransferase [Jiangellaceae bacterium]|nr:class I SAM-dependent methyltransferase [Jiangellaceae bacterium]